MNQASVVVEDDEDRELEFVLRREDLLERFTVQEVEALEWVDDPLGAAPRLPFGHLNPAWRAFLARGADGDELWSFRASWRPYAYDTSGEIRQGYALWRDGAAVAWMLTDVKWWAYLEDEDEDGAPDGDRASAGRED